MNFKVKVFAKPESGIRFATIIETAFGCIKKNQFDGKNAAKYIHKRHERNNFGQF